MNDILLALQSIISSAVGNGYTVFYGRFDPTPESVLPLIEIVAQSTTPNHTGTGGLMDEEIIIEVRLKVAMKSFLKTNTNISIVSHHQELIKVMEERNANRTYKSNTIMGAITTNPSLNGTIGIVNAYNIDYTVVEDARLAQATLRISAKRQIPTC